MLDLLLWIMDTFGVRHLEDAMGLLLAGLAVVALGLLLVANRRAA